jgi:hypothetical protein
MNWQEETTMTKVKQISWLGAMLALLVLAAGAALAQEGGPRDLRQIKVVSVDGNTVVVWDQFGGQEYTVPDGYRFTADGKEIGASDLKPGMEASAEVQEGTGVTVRPVHITEIKMGTVVSQVGRSVTVKDENGAIHRFSQSEADDRGVRLVMDDKPMRLSELQAGDQLSATIVSAEQPEILTAADVEAEISGEAAAGAETAESAAESAGATAADAAEEATDAAGDLAGKWWLWLLLLVVIAAIVYLASRKPKKVVTK